MGNKFQIILRGIVFGFWPAIFLVEAAILYGFFNRWNEVVWLLTLGIGVIVGEFWVIALEKLISAKG